MYTLHKAKEEIDAVAKHATDIASHLMTLSDDVRGDLQGFKKDILDAIDKKFVEFERAFQGDTAIAESSAVADLGAKVSLLSAGKSSPDPESDGGYRHTDQASSDEHNGHAEHQPGDHAPGGDHRPNGDHQPGDHRY